jgi:predicted RNase H-like HicB family nuclease
MEDFKLPESISCMLHLDTESGAWVSRCLDFDLVTSGKTEKESWANLKSVVKLHIEHCFTNNRGALSLHRADDEDFALFRKMTETGNNFWSDKIELNLVAPPPKVPDQISFWIKGVNSSGTCKAASSLLAVH